jgi:hypothetical protein
MQCCTCAFVYERISRRLAREDPCPFARSQQHGISTPRLADTALVLPRAGSRRGPRRHPPMWRAMASSSASCYCRRPAPSGGPRIPPPIVKVLCVTLTPLGATRTMSSLVCHAKCRAQFVIALRPPALYELSTAAASSAVLPLSCRCCITYGANGRDYAGSQTAFVAVATTCDARMP